MQVNSNKKENKFAINTEWQFEAPEQLQHLGMDL